MFSPKRLASSRDSRRVLPCSLVSRTAISSTLESMCCAALCRISRRWLEGSFDQVMNAFAAACAALSTSAAPPAGTSSTTSPVAGLRTSYVLPDAALVLSPSMIIVAMRHPRSYFYGSLNPLCRDAEVRCFWSACDAAKTSPRVAVPPADRHVPQLAALEPAFELFSPQVEGDGRDQVIEHDVVVPAKAETRQ